MSKKTLLNEATVRRFMKLAEMEPFASNFINEMYTAPAMADDDEPTPEEDEFDVAYEEEGEEKGFEAGVEAGEEEVVDDLGVDVEVEDEDAAVDEEGGELVLTDEEAEVFLKVADKVRAAMEGGEVEDVPAPDMGAEEELELGAEEELELGAEEEEPVEDIEVEEEELELEEDQKYGGDKGDESRSRRDYKQDDKKRQKYGGDKGDESRSRRDFSESISDSLVNEIARKVTQRVLRARKK